MRVAARATFFENAMSNTAQPLKIAILAMGGEGGGVLADWLVSMGEHCGWIAQTTSVPGVAQRTGATIYYVELFPWAQAQADRGEPVLALMPLPGDVDVVLASELMEAGRAVLRGLVTPERTTLIASSHRVYSMAEKMAMGEGRVDSAELMAQAGAAARKLVLFDMAEVASQCASVISAVLFGALAASGCLPFRRADFEDTIRRSGVGVKSSLQAFDQAFRMNSSPDAGCASSNGQTSTPSSKKQSAPTASKEVADLIKRIDDAFAVEVRTLIRDGVRRLLDYQDPAYASLYLDRLVAVSSLPCSGESRLLREMARYLALWMSYEDTIRVADLKTRASRFARVADEVGVQGTQLLSIREFMHPRLEEVCDTLPVWLGRAPWMRRLLGPLVGKGRVISTSSLTGFLLLYGIARLRRWRRATLRYQVENLRILEWLDYVAEASHVSPELALEVVLCQRLVKGYGDTHSRGFSNYQLLMTTAKKTGWRLAAATLRELREAALADEHGQQLQKAMGRHALAL